MILRRLAIGTSLLLVTMEAMLGTAQGQTITLTPAGALPSGVMVSVLDFPQDSTPRPVAVGPDGAWTIEVQADADAWRNEPTILIAVPARTSALEGVSSDPVTLQLDFSFKATDSDVQIDVPVQIFTSFGARARDQIERMPQFQRYEQILMAQSLAQHFLGRLENPEDALTQRMVQLWFDALFRATGPDESRPLRLGSEVQNAVSRAFASNADKKAYFESLIAQLRQRFWRDQADFEALISQGYCGFAMNIAKDLKRRHAAHPEDAAPGAASVGEPDQVIADLAQRSADCA